MFPTFGVNVQITIIPLVGLGSWLYGRRFGLLMVIPIIVYSYFLLGPIYGDRLVYYEAKGGGIMIMAVTAILIGSIRSNYDDTKNTNINLDHRVKERNAELSKLAVKLINDVEATRISQGQMLHDGIGQQLTGIQLYCNYLAEQLAEESNQRAAVAFSIRTKAERAHNIVRKTARMLFPVRMSETGLEPAINELVSCMKEIKHLSIDATYQCDCDDISEKLALTLYRICHESTAYTVTELEASSIHLAIHLQDARYIVTVQHNGSPWSLLKDNMAQRLILYRLQSLGGTFSVDYSTGNSETIIYRIPKIV